MPMQNTMTASRPPPAVTLFPMPAAEFDAYRRITLEHYAADLLRMEGGTVASTAQRAAQDFETLLPEGMHTDNQHFFTLQCVARQTTIGYLWLGENATERGPGAFIYDMLILPACRGMGYGTQTLREAEAWARQRGMTHIGLAAFGHNEGALRLYRRMGYQTTQLRMSKALAVG